MTHNRRGLWIENLDGTFTAWIGDDGNISWAGVGKTPRDALNDAKWKKRGGLEYLKKKGIA